MSQDPIAEWIETNRDVLAALTPVGDTDATVQYTLTGGPDGRVVLGVVIAGGRVTDLVSGRMSSPDCKVTLSHETACRIIDGTVGLDFAFMTGALKVEGDHALWLIGLRRLREAALKAIAGGSGDDT